MAPAPVSESGLLRAKVGSRGTSHAATGSLCPEGGVRGIRGHLQSRQDRRTDPECEVVSISDGYEAVNGIGQGGNMSVGRLGARLVIGALFIGHGTQKIFGWFGGPGRAGTEAMMEHIDMRPAKVQALLAGTTETVGGTLLAAGLATPLASAALTGVMTTAIRKVHLPNGPWATNGGGGENPRPIRAGPAPGGGRPGGPS